MSVARSSACFCRNDASPAGSARSCSAAAAGRACSCSARRAVRAVARRPRGRWSGAGSAPDGACRSPPPGPRSATRVPPAALVAAWKERGISRVAAVATDLVAETVPPPPVEVLTFVPGEGDRVGWRGANPAEELSHALGLRWGLPAAPLLARRRRVRPQRGLTRPERSANVQAAFRTVTASPRSVGLIDDVYTTGATVGAAARELRRAGARTVHVVTFARVVRG